MFVLEKAVENCGFRILYKKRPDVIKRIKIR